MEPITYTFRNITYEFTDKWEETCLNDSKEFQLEQFKYLERVGDYTTIKNRIVNQETFGYLKKIS